MNNAKPTLLFVCVHNAGRSQLAAGLAALRGGEQVTVLSAGLDPDDKVSDVALASLAEAGIDRSDQTPTRLTDDLVAQADIVVTLKPGLDLPHHEACATKPGRYPTRLNGTSTAFGHFVTTSTPRSSNSLRSYHSREGPRNRTRGRGRVVMKGAQRAPADCPDH